MERSLFVVAAALEFLTSSPAHSHEKTLPSTVNNMQAHHDRANIVTNFWVIYMQPWWDESTGLLNTGWTGQWTGFPVMRAVVVQWTETFKTVGNAMAPKKTVRT
ncbi:unnamed protein product [Calypogeia fissa]